jgi:hypothetical protein
MDKKNQNQNPSKGNQPQKGQPGKQQPTPSKNPIKK